MNPVLRNGFLFPILIFLLSFTTVFAHPPAGGTNRIAGAGRPGSAANVAPGPYAVTASGTGGCGCDFTVVPNPADDQAVVDGQVLGVKPGNKVCIAATHYLSISMTNMYGSPGNPVTVVNCGGQVSISGYSAYGFILHSSRYVHITGSGDAGYKYGFVIDGSVAGTSYGYGEDNHVSDIEVDHFDVGKIAGVGMGCAPTPTCDPASWSTSWKMYSMSFHDNYVHETSGEGFYIGNTQPYYIYNCGAQGTVTVQPQQIDSLRFYNNIIDKAGWTAAQISLITGGVDIHDNLITNFGFLNKPQHQTGLIVGGISHGRVYNNKIISGTGNAFEYFGAGLTTVYNNIFVGAGFDGSAQGQGAVFIDDRPKPPGFPGLKIYLVNNTIVGPARNGISFYNDYGTVDAGNVIANNIVASPGLYASFPAFAYFDIQNNPQVTLYNNLTVPTNAQAGFVNAGGNDFHLQSSSAAIDAGINAGIYGINNDMDRSARPYGPKYDIGAYEYHGGVAPSLIANAGGNQTITLPVNTVTLNASQSFDPSGTITGYSWSETSGPSAAAISNKAAISTAVTGLVQGTYVFKLIVTDNKGASATDSMNLTVNAQVLPLPPIANAGGNQTIMLPVNTVTLNASKSSDPNGMITGYSWSEASGPSAAAISNKAAISTAVTGLVQGTYVFKLVVTDNKGASATDSMTLTVNAQGSLPPVAKAGGNQTITLPVVNAVTLNASQSFDPNGTITGYSWSEASGPSAAALSNKAAISTAVTGLVQGTYVFKLVVSNNKGASASDSMKMTVISGMLPMPPVANAGQDITIVLPANSALLNGSGSTDPIGVITSYNWTQLNGPTKASIASSDSVVSTIGNLVIGQYAFQLSVQNSSGMRSLSTVKVNVISELRYSQAVIIYPNPVHDVLNLRIISDKSGTVRLNVFDMAGRNMMGEQMDKHQPNIEHSINVSRLARGQYNLQLIIGNNKSETVSFIKF